MKTLKQIQRNGNDWADYNEGPQTVYGAVWGVPFWTDKDVEWETQTYTDADLDDDADTMECIDVIYKAEAWDGWFKKANKLVRKARKSVVDK